MSKKSFLENRIKVLEDMITERDTRIIELTEKLVTKDSKKKKEIVDGD